MGSVPVLPPWTSKNGFMNTMQCPYLLPGVWPTTDICSQQAASSPFFKSKAYKLSSASPPPPTAPPKTAIYKLSIHKLWWAARFDGPWPFGFSFLHFLFIISNRYVSPVIVYFPVSPIAPPNNTATDYESIVIVCPNLGYGLSPINLTTSTVDIILLFYYLNLN